MIRVVLSVFALGACTTSSLADETDTPRLDWLSGCWQSEDGRAREVWSGSESGYYFGYALTLADGNGVFFEHMRIDPGPAPVFNAYPAGQGPSAFPALDMSDASITFANPEHDYPQKIRYFLEGDELKATISLMDGTRSGQFEYARCTATPE